MKRKPNTDAIKKSIEQSKVRRAEEEIKIQEIVDILKSGDFKTRRARRASEVAFRSNLTDDERILAARHAVDGRVLTHEEQAEYDRLSYLNEFGTLANDHPIYGNRGECLREAGPEHEAAVARLTVLDIIHVAGLMLATE